MRDPLSGIKTKKGRVVYDRKANPFRVSDFLRISKKLSVLRFFVTTEVFDQILQSVSIIRSDAGTGAGFSDGQFGGAGATRTFAEGIEVKRIVVIIEGE